METNDCNDSLIDSEWSLVKDKVLGFGFWVLGMEEDNYWRLHITTVENVLNLWRQHHLSLYGKALVINTLVLSPLWYVAQWVSSELNTFVFSVWNGKRDLVARCVIVQPFCFGGFSVVDFDSKVSALHLEWVRRCVVSPSIWVVFMSFWFFSFSRLCLMLFSLSLHSHWSSSFLSLSHSRLPAV